MKIRTDFVTNSSSSNFSIVVSVRTGYGCVCLDENPGERMDSGGDARFNGDLQAVNEHLSSVTELATWLAESTSTNTDWYGNEQAYFKQKKRSFVDEACRKIKDVRDIESITVLRKYDAWGEFADLIADNDRRLNSLARKYLNSSGIAHERAEAEMVTYIQNTTDVPFGEWFGCGYPVIRYNWNGKSLDKIARALCSDRAISGGVSGTESINLNMKTGEYVKEAVFDLNPD